jgi:hypothetical protein
LRDYAWHDYPASVPLEQRQPCVVHGCGEPAVVVETSYPSAIDVGMLVDVEDRLSPYCKPHAIEQGWKPPAAPIPEAHLNIFQRWVVRELSRGVEPGCA